MIQVFRDFFGFFVDEFYLNKCYSILTKLPSASPNLVSKDSHLVGRKNKLMDVHFSEIRTLLAAVSVLCRRTN
jgi:hypothetical protein